MPNGLPMPMGPPPGNPMGGPMPGGPPMPGGGPQEEVGQLLALRDQIDQRLAELMGGQMPGVAQMAAAPMPAASGLLPGAGPQAYG